MGDSAKLQSGTVRALTVCWLERIWFIGWSGQCVDSANRVRLIGFTNMPTHVQLSMSLCVLYMWECTSSTPFAASDFGHCRVFKKHIFTFKMSTLTTHYGNINLAPWIPQTSLLMGWEVYMCRWHKLSEMISLWTISIFNDLAMQITTRDAPFDVAFLCLCDFLASFW